MKELFSGCGEFVERVTFDIDYKAFPHDLIHTLITTKHLVGFKAKKSNSKGWHIIAYFSKRKSKRWHNHIRELFDDELRIIYDKKERPNNILFSKKKLIKWWHKFLINYSKSQHLNSTYPF